MHVGKRRKAGFSTLFSQRGIKWGDAGKFYPAPGIPAGPDRGFTFCPAGIRKYETREDADNFNTLIKGE